MATDPQQTVKRLGRLQPPKPNPELTDAVRKVSATSNALIDEAAKVIVGKRDVLDLVTLNILAAGNILFEDVPGLAKSLMANTFSQASGCDFKRIQFTPDVLPSDIVGIYMFNQKTSEFEFRPGPVFTNFLLADEINRAPPKTQAALLETMAERQVTVEGTTHKLEKPYIVMATQNPVEQEGTYPLPEAQMDRFLMKLSVGYPSRDDEMEILRRRMERRKDEADVKPVANPRTIVAMQKVVERVYVDREILRYIADLVVATRVHDDIRVGSSPRGALALFKLSRANAVLQGREFVIPDDVKRVLNPAIAHRLILKPEPRIKGVTGEDVLADVVQEVQVPKV